MNENNTNTPQSDITDTSQSANIIIDAQSEKVGTALVDCMKMLRVVLTGNTPIVASISKPKDRKDLFYSLLGCGKLAEQELPWLIMQQVDLQKIKNFKPPEYFFADRKKLGKIVLDKKRVTDQSSHPLLYRLEAHKLQRYIDAIKGNEKPQIAAAYAKFSVPIIYFGYHRLIKSDDENLSNPSKLMFMDSSIWHRYYCLLDPLEDLFDIILDMWKWYNDYHLYETVVALEYLDYSIRTLRSQYIEDFGSHDLAHGSHVCLTPFCSETEVAKNITGNGEKRWNLSSCRYLLVDDFANDELHCCSDTNSVTKLKLLNDLLELESTTQRPTIKPKISCVSNVDDAMTKLNEKKGMHDVILLDYLLGSKIGKTGRSYGTELIYKLNNEDVPNRGPLKHFWVFPVSAFSGAFSAELQRGGIQNLGMNYFLSSGADPICTPNLFKYKLLEFVGALQAAAPRSPCDMLTSFYKVYTSSKGVDEKKINISALRKTAKKQYSDFVEVVGHLRTLRKDNETGSLFVKQFLEDWENAEYKSEHLEDHLVELVRLLAWAPGLEWPTMVEELHRCGELLKEELEQVSIKEFFKIVSDAIDHWQNNFCY